jgi:ADP-ribose diphosphatase
MGEKPHILKRHTIAESHIFKLEGLHLRFTNGEERHYERICGRGSGSVMVIPFLDDDTLLLIREYGAGVDGYVLGFPKGLIEAGEDLLETANRELMEEVGYGAKDLSFLRRVSVSPGYMSSEMDIVLAKDLYPQIEQGDEPEEIEVVKWPLSKIDALLVHPEFHEARSIAALLMVARQANV